MSERDYTDDQLETWLKEQYELDDDRKTQELVAVEHRTDWKPPKRLSRSDVWRKHRPGIAWKLAVLERDQGCVVHANPKDCREGWQAHHVVSQQRLRREHPDVLWHPLVGIGVCGRAHRRHHSGYEPIPYDMLPLAVLDFLTGLGYSEYLLRHYP